MSGRRYYLNNQHESLSSHRIAGCKKSIKAITGKLALHLQQGLSRFLNPALCLTCGQPVDSASFICPDCQLSLQTVPKPCSCCGLPNPASGLICPACRHKPPRWQSLVAPLIYQGNARQLIHELKFNEQIQIANAILTHLYPYYAGHPVDILIPVPLHKSHLLERGFNQAEEIANILALKLNIPVDRNSLSRIKATESQSGLSLNKRRQNILQAFEFNAENHYHSVAIVDDIITTGSTVSEICKLLKRSGVKHVEVWSLARTLKP